MKVLQYTAVFAVVLGCLEAALPPENPMPGGWFDIQDAANDEKVQQMADFAANQMGYTVVTINAAQSAVVAGFKYRIEVVLQRNGANTTCIVVVWDKLNNQGQELLSRKCLRQ